MGNHKRPWSKKILAYSEYVRDFEKKNYLGNKNIDDYEKCLWILTNVHKLQILLQLSNFAPKSLENVHQFK